MLKLFAIKKVSEIFVIILIISLIFSILQDFMLDEKDIKGKKYKKFTKESIFENLYFTIVTFLTIGYGDMHPATDRGRRYVSGLILLSNSVFFYYLSTL